MTVHCFGLAISPFVAGFALHRTAEENRAKLSENLVEAVCKNIDVDDGLT